MSAAAKAKRHRSDPNWYARYLALHIQGMSTKAFKRLPVGKSLEVRAAVLRLTSPVNGLSPSV
jgi:hypothetical protein